MTLVNSKCRTFCIPTPLIFVAKSLSSLSCIGRVTLYLKVPESFSLILPTVTISFIIFFKIMDDFVLEKGVMLALIGLSNFCFFFIHILVIISKNFFTQANFWGIHNILLFT